MLQLCIETLESKRFKQTRKTKYMECKFRKTRNRNEVVVANWHNIPKSECFRYLGFMIIKNGDSKEDFAHKIKAA